MEKIKFINESMLVDREELESNYIVLIKKLEEKISDKDRDESFRLFGMVQTISYILKEREYGGARYNSVVKLMNKKFRVHFEEYILG